MVEIVGAGTAMHFSPKDLRLNVGFLGLFWAVLRLISDCYWSTCVVCVLLLI